MEASFKKNIAVIILFFFTIVIIAQKNKGIDSSFLKEIYKTYNEAASYEMAVEVAMYDIEGKLSSPKQKNYTIKSENNFYIQTQEITTVRTPEFQLMINHNSKEIQYLKYNKKQTQEILNQTLKSNIPDFSKMDTMIDSMKKNESTTELVFKENLQYKKTVYTFNSTSKLLEKVDYYSEGKQYGQPAHIQINYTTKKLNQEENTVVFQLEKYLINEGDKLRPADSFKTYSLINNTIDQ